MSQRKVQVTAVELMDHLKNIVQARGDLGVVCRAWEQRSEIEMAEDADDTFITIWYDDEDPDGEVISVT